MSTPTDMAELIRNRILTPPAADELATLLDLTHIDVIIYRQQSLDAAVAAAVAKTSGCAITIEWAGFRALDSNASRPRIAEVYNILVYSKPIIDDGARPAELVIKSIIKRMWHWVPQGGHAFDEAVPSSGGIVPSKKYLVYDCEVTVPVIL